MLKVLYEDNHLIAVEKPANMPTQGDSSGDQSLLEEVREYLKTKYNKPGNAYVGLVHRLDRPVGGAMVFAKTSKGASRLSEQFRNRGVKKTYVAMVAGAPKTREGRLAHILTQGHNNRVLARPAEEDAQENVAISDYLVRESSEEKSILELHPITGKKHQLRAQLSRWGHPILGDGKYGSREKFRGRGIALWAEELVIKHPTEDREIKITCPADPSIFQI